MRKWHKLIKSMIIDLDAHSGNGHERDFIKDKDVHIVDAYNPTYIKGTTMQCKLLKLI